MTGNERLARAVRLFFRGGPWSTDDRAVWESMTGHPTPTAATLCDFARDVLSDERMRSHGLPQPPTNQEGVKAVLRGIRRTIGMARGGKAPATADVLMLRVTKRRPRLN